MRRLVRFLSLLSVAATLSTGIVVIPAALVFISADVAAAAVPLPYSAGPPTPNSVLIDSNKVWFTKPGQTRAGVDGRFNCGWVEYLEVEDLGDVGTYRRLAYKDGELIQTRILTDFRDSLVSSSSSPGAVPVYDSLVAPPGFRLSFMSGAGLGCGRTPEQQAQAAAYVAGQKASSAEIVIEVWFDGPNNLPPVPRIDEPGRFGPGEYQFVGSASEDPDGGPLQYYWSFGDGTTGSGAVAGHTYTKPGLFTVSLTVTDDEGESRTASVQVEVEAPQLGVGLVLPDEIAIYREGEVVPIKIRLRATEGVGNLSDVRFVGDPLRVAPTTAMEVTSGPVPEIPADIVLEPNGPALEFEFEVTAVLAGSFRLLSTVTAMDAADRLVGPVEVERNGRIGQLTVTMTSDPGEVDLDEKDDGPIPQTVMVTVEVTNPLDDPVDVTLDVDEPQFLDQPQGNADYLPFVYGELDADENPPVPAPVPDIDLGTIAAGQSKSVEIPAVALDDGTIELDVLATGVGERNGESLVVRGVATHTLEIRSDVVFFFDAEIDENSLQDRTGLPGSGQWVKGGNAWQLNGRIENRSSEETIEVTIIPMISRNAGSGVPVPDGTTLTDPECAVGLVQLLEPGEELEFIAAVRTLSSGGTRSEVVYVPRVVIIEDNGDRTPLTEDQALIAEGAAEHEVSVDVSEPVAQPPGLLRETWAFSSSFVVAVAELVASIAGLVWALLPINPNNLQSNVAGSIRKYADYIVTLYANLPADERGLFEAFYIETLVSDLGMKLDEAVQFVRGVPGAVGESWRGWNDALAAEVEQGDTEAITGRMGRLIGGNIDSAIPVLAGLCKMMKAVPLSRAALIANDVRIAEDLARLGSAVDVTSIPTGAFITRALRRSLWGIDDAMSRRVQDFVDRWGVVIGVRRRGPGSIAKIESGTHYGKIYAVKAKNIDEIDARYLGFPDDLDTAMISRPPAKDDLLSSIAGLSDEEQAKVLSRYYQRMDEWYGKPRNRNLPDGPRDFSTSERFKFEQWSARGTAPAPIPGGVLDFSDNVRSGRSVPPDGGFTREVPFDPIVGRDGAGRPTSYIPRVDQGRGMRALTGDMDPVVVSKPDFSQLSEAQRIRFYEEAQKLGFEHVESATWNNPNGRAKYVRDHSYYEEGSEALFAWIPNSQPRAVRLDPRMSQFVGNNPADAVHVYLRGSKIEWRSTEPNLVDFDGHEFDDPLGFQSPRTIFLIDEECANARTPEALTLQGTDACPLPYDRGEDAIILRGVLLGGYEQWTPAEGWQPYEFGDVVNETLLPLTVLTDDVAAGGSRAPIIDRDALGLGAGEGWFEVGDVVVIDPGGPNEEFVGVAGFGSLVFDRPLTNAHLAGTVVAVVEPAAVPTVVLPGVEFSDVGPGGWFSAAVGWAAGERITTGLGDGRFGPYDDLERAQLVTMVWRAAGSPVVTSGVPFTDVDLDGYYGPALRWAYANGIVEGTSATTFEPYSTATRGHVVAVLWRWSGRPVPAGSTPFSDTAPGRYFTVPATWAEQEDVTTGLPGGRFGPDQGADRATLVTMLHRLLT
jgi:PKD repeat protein